MVEVDDIDYYLRDALSPEEGNVCLALNCPYLTTTETGGPACQKMIEATELDRDFVKRLPEKAARISLDDRLTMIVKFANETDPQEPPPTGCPKKLDVIVAIPRL